MDEVQEPAAAEKDLKGAAKGKADAAKKGEKSGVPLPTPMEVAQSQEQNHDPNASKFIPGAIHYERSKHNTTQPFVDLVNYNSFMKTEE